MKNCTLLNTLSKFPKCVKQIKNIWNAIKDLNLISRKKCLKHIYQRRSIEGNATIHLQYF